MHQNLMVHHELLIDWGTLASSWVPWYPLVIQTATVRLSIWAPRILVPMQEWVLHPGPMGGRHVVTESPPFFNR